LRTQTSEAQDLGLLGHEYAEKGNFDKKLFKKLENIEIKGNKRMFNTFIDGFPKGIAKKIPSLLKK
jgi:2-methylaconitate cis-trans-isomerase PrpF